MSRAAMDLLTTWLVLVTGVASASLLVDDLLRREVAGDGAASRNRLVGLGIAAVFGALVVARFALLGS